MATVTTAASAIRQAFTGEVINAVFCNRDFFNLFPTRPASGASTERWNLVQTGIAGATFNEGGAFSAAGNNTYAAPGIDKGRWQGTYSYTEDLEQDLAIGESRVFNAIALEASECLAGVFDAAMTTMIGAAGMGLQLAIDSAGTYAGLNRATTTGWDSNENALGGVLTIAALQNAQETLVNVQRVGTPNVCFCAPNQITNYLNLAGPGATTSLVRYNTDSNGVVSANVGENPMGAKFGNMDILPIRDLTNTLWFMTQRENFYIAVWDGEGMTGGVKVQDVPPAGHQREVNISLYCALIHTDPFRSHKETGVTA